MSLPQKNAIHIWLIGAVALFINSIGGYDFIMTLSKNQDYFLSLSYNARQIEYFTNYPMLLAFFWFIGVWAAFAGSISILLRSRYSRILFLIAILGQIILDAYSFFFKHRWEVLGPRLGAQDLIVLAFTILLAIYSHYLIKRGFVK